MGYKVLFSPHAAKFHRKADPDLRRRIHAAVEAIAGSPTAGPQVKCLQGVLKNVYRYRIGDYRILYAVSHEKREVYVDYIQHRRDVYRT